IAARVCPRARSPRSPRASTLRPRIRKISLNPTPATATGTPTPWPRLQRSFRRTMPRIPTARPARRPSVRPRPPASESRTPERPAFVHPEFDYENRIVAVNLGDVTVASVYVPNGGKDFAAKMKFLEAMDGYAASLQASGRALVMMGDMNVARTERDVHPKER